MRGHFTLSHIIFHNNFVYMLSATSFHMVHSVGPTFEHSLEHIGWYSVNNACYFCFQCINRLWFININKWFRIPAQKVIRRRQNTRSWGQFTAPFLEMICSWKFSFNKRMVSPAVWHIEPLYCNHKSATPVSWICGNRNSLINKMIEEHEKRFLLSTNFENKFPQFVNVVHA